MDTKNKKKYDLKAEIHDSVSDFLNTTPSHHDDPACFGILRIILFFILVLTSSEKYLWLGISAEHLFFGWAFLSIYTKTMKVEHGELFLILLAGEVATTMFLFLVYVLLTDRRPVKYGLLRTISFICSLVIFAIVEKKKGLKMVLLLFYTLEGMVLFLTWNIFNIVEFLYYRRKANKKLKEITLNEADVKKAEQVFV